MTNEKIAYLKERLHLRKSLLKTQKDILILSIAVFIVKTIIDIILYKLGRLNYLHGFGTGVLLMSMAHLFGSYSSFKSDVKDVEMDILELEGLYNETINSTK